MENLGCVTFRETRCCSSTASAATQAELQRVTDVIAHELAHMWFGDLVTMRWWNGIWLNEAFATFMEMKATDAFRPEWERWVDFGLSRSAAFDTDSLVDHPRHRVRGASRRPTPRACSTSSPTRRAPSVVRMLEQYLGEERFRDGIRRYLRTHAYANTETTDLWDAIEAATGEPVRRIMDTWIFQGGSPGRRPSSWTTTAGRSGSPSASFRYDADGAGDDAGSPSPGRPASSLTAARRDRAR